MIVNNFQLRSCNSNNSFISRPLLHIPITIPSMCLCDVCNRPESETVQRIGAEYAEQLPSANALSQKRDWRDASLAQLNALKQQLSKTDPSLPPSPAHK